MSNSVLLFFDGGDRIHLSYTMKVGPYMDKNEFDMDFDFSEEFGLNLDDLTEDAGQDFSFDFDVDEKRKAPAVEDFSFDMDNLDLNAFLPDDDELSADDLLNSFLAGDDTLTEAEEEAQEPESESDADADADADASEDSFLDDMDDLDFLLGEKVLDEDDLYESGETEEPEEAESVEAEDEETPEQESQTDEDSSEDFRFEMSNWESAPDFGSTDTTIHAPGLSAEEDAPDYDEDIQAEKRARKKSGFKLPAIKLPFGRPKADEAAEEDDRTGEETGRRRSKPARPAKPSFFSKVLDLYLGPITHPVQEPAERVDENGRVRRRRRKTKAQIFKEVYLPPLIAAAGLLMICVFIVGSVTNAFKQRTINDEKHRRESIAASIAADEAQGAYEQAIAQAELYAANYDYNKAIELLDSLINTDSTHSEALISKKSEYSKALSNLVEWKDISQIPNLSFHVLIADPARAFADKELGGLYNRNFVTVDEFEKILKELYANDFILVDFDTLVQTNPGLDGRKNFFNGGLYLPAGKTPVMITETMVNYFEYMIDSNKDGVPDANGHGFASKLVVDGNGDIKAQMVDASGNTVVGNYDLVPVLESFIAEHPDFSYRGSRATLAVSGSEGIFGYRTNTSYISTRGQAFYDQEVAEAKVLVDALNEKGYNIACYTYANVNYKNMTVVQIQADQQNWASQILPIIGDCEILVYAREGDIDDYTGNKFTQLYNSGYRYFVTNGDNPSTDVKDTFVRQSRLMVTGNAMGWYSSRFAKYFDSNKVLDMNARNHNIPN